MSALPDKEILRIELDKIIQKIVTAQQTLGIKDSGRSAASIKIKGSRVLSAVIEADAYLQTNFDGVGRGPGGMPPVSAIESWGKLQPRGNQTRLQAAYAVAVNIAQEGTAIFRGAKGIDFDKIVKESATEMANNMADNKVAQTLDVLDQFRFVKE